VSAAAVAVKLAALLPDAPALQAASFVRNAGGGMAVPLAASALLVAAGFAPGRRWAWLDIIHLMWLGALLGLWGYAAWG
jgi:hypothetical protein